jgi:macrolide transport system ATP-binding/permease protein
LEGQLNHLRAIRSDVVVGSRRLLKSPGFASVCTLTLALGIGGNTAVFTLIDRVMLEPLPVQRPSELYRLGDGNDCCVNSGLPRSFSLFSYDLYTHLREAAPQFSQLAAFQATTRVITIGHADTDAPPETLNGAFVSGNYFQLFELVPAAGRLVEPSDDRRGAAPVAVISYKAWIDRFQARGDVAGSSITLNGVPATIVGVAPKGFYGDTLRPNPADIWVPLSNEPALQPAARLLEGKPQHWLYAIGRLKPGVAILPIQSQLTAAVQQWVSSTLELSPDERARIPQQHITITSAAMGVTTTRDRVSPTLKLLQGIAGAVLLIACANLANLLLARGLTRRTDTAVRVALGAPRGRLVLQSLVESVLLACAGGLAGLLIAFAAARAIIDLAFAGATSVPVDPSPSLGVLTFAFAASLVTGLIFGAAPAVIGSRADPIDAMRGAGRTAGERGSRLRQSLIVVQVALSLVLIACAGLLGRSLQQLQAQDFGFRVDGRYVVSLAPSLGTVPSDQLQSTYARMQEALRRIAGVNNAAFSLYGPMSGDNWSGNITVEGHDTSEQLTASWNRVSARYFDTIGTPLVRGRAFDERDGPGSPFVAVVSQTFARKFFGDTDPIGRHLKFGDGRNPAAPALEIVGVVGDANYQDGRRPPVAHFFVPFLQRVGSGNYDRSHYPGAIEIHAAAGVPGLDQEIRRALSGVDRRITVRTVLAMDTQIAGAFNLERLIARLTVAFGLVALLLACLGLYGVTAYSVSRRTREIGVRMAIGASRGHVVRGVLRGALVQVAIGIAIGLPASFVAGRLLQAQLFGVSGRDPLAFAGGTLLLVLSTLVAALIPARRAASMDPVTALRTE